MARSIDNTEDIIDSRDVIARIEELEALADDSDYEMDDDERHELEALRALAEEAAGCAGDWQHGEALIRWSYFKTYAEELAEDIGAIGRDVQWPLGHIDWEAAADELQIDYASVDFDGVEYWIR